MAASTFPAMVRLLFQTAGPSRTPAFSAVIWGSAVSVEVNGAFARTRGVWEECPAWQSLRPSGSIAGTGGNIGLSGMWNVNRACYQQQPSFML